MSKRPHALPGYPRELLLLSVDPAEEVSLHDQLEQANAGKYELRRIEQLSQLKLLDLEGVCHAVLLDMRIERSQALDAIHWIGNLHTKVALICLCRNHEQLMSYREVIHLVDDYLLAESLMDGELPTRISHAIRRRLKEYELLHDQALLHSLLDNIPDAVYFKDKKSQFTKVNEAMAQKYGLSDRSILGLTDFDLFTREHAQPAFSDEKNIMTTGEPIIGKLEKETFEDGSIGWVNTTKLPLKDAKDNIIGTMGISRDVTDLHEAQENLRKEHNLLQTILNNIPDQVFVKDGEGRYIGANPPQVKFLGAKSEASVIGTTVLDHMNDEAAKRSHQVDLDVMRDAKGLIDFEERRERPDGSEIWNLTSKVPLFDDSGNAVGTIGISRDITLQKANELKLRQTIEILNEAQLQLIEAEKLKTVGRLAAGVAHEVKNPLGVVTLGVEYLKKQIEGPRALLDLLNDMEAATRKANDVIFELLDYSAPHEVSMESGDLNGLIERVLALMRHNFNEARVTVTSELAPELQPISMDGSKLEQVFIKLFLNAISVMPEGGELTVRSLSTRMQHTGNNVSSEMTERFRIGDPLAVVEIEDTGHGIDEENLNKLFDPFFSTRTTGNGTGLGLSVTRSIVEMHRGYVTLENKKKGRGACARLIFPTTPSK